MSKRLHDTFRWDKPEFRKLPPKIKCAIGYIRSKCNNAGIWTLDLDTLSYFVGEQITEQDFNILLNDTLTFIGDNKYLLNDYFEIQFGRSNNSPAYLSALKELEKHIDVEQLPNSYLTVIKNKTKNKNNNKNNIYRDRECEGKGDENCHRPVMTSGELLNAIRLFGRNNGSQARIALGGASWELIEANGGWARMCDLTPKDIDYKFRQPQLLRKD